MNITLCGIRLQNPTILASGILGVTKESIDRLGKKGAGAVTLKSLCHEERKGNPNPTMFAYPGGFLNGVGLPGQGIESACTEFERLDDLSIPVIGSIFGYTLEQFGSVAKKMSSLKPAMIEVDISCPHMDYGQVYDADPALAAKVTKEVKRNVGKIPVSIKLSPKIYDIKAMAKAVEEAGADAITAINAYPGMVIDLETCRPLLASKIGGISGPALKPIAVKCVYEIYETVKIPIIGTGGVTSGKDAIEMIMAGATAVGIGTAVYYHGDEVFLKICEEMESWMKEHKISSLDAIRGCAHQQQKK
ncbi:dihydroorotate dehydrogenase [Candidatus Woesearchaeota archaeon]|nr:dihydroorotate dehydrogenase [Candidatus Woesearchaeota archaeon]